MSIFEGGNVAPAQTTGARYQPQDYGPGIGPGLEALGQGIGDVAQAAGRFASHISEMHDEAAVKEATNGINEWFAGAAYTGPNAYFEQKGKDALYGRGQIEKGLDTLVQDRRKTLQNPRQQRMYDDAVTPQRQQWGIQIAKHASDQTRTYAANEAAARAGMTGEMAGLSYMKDPAQGEQYLTTMRAEIAERFRLEGAGPDQIIAEQLKATSSVYQDIGTQLAYSGAQGPELAQKFIELHGGSMTNDARQSVITHARVQQNAMEAEQRRIESENRRVANEAKRDAHDRAQTAAQNIDLGIPMKPEDYTSALGDAQTSGDEGLVHRIQVGQFKNGLSIQYQNATPYQLQARVNDLNTGINKAGTNAKPEQVIERDHLMTMLGRSRAELKSDPLAWGAQHLGINISPLILNNPDSIRSRMQAVSAIQKSTGMAVAPLQPDEVQVAQGTLAHGDTKQKIDLALKLSAFGSMAGSAAEQVTNNAGFINLIGLATHSNRGVAASRVNQIVTGYDALKTKPKLVDKNQAQRQFNEMVGTSLQFLPQVRDGVFSNAQALLGAQANEHGWSEWGQIDSRAWFRSVNSALGAYSKDGKQIGGLAAFNGAVTVLPESMSQDEFEERISKAHGPAFRQAQNGEPAYADGRTPTATDLKKMQWVPSGDGIYRISDGNGFLKTKSGGFYEIDVTRLSSLDADLAAHGYSRY